MTRIIFSILLVLSFFLMISAGDTLSLVGGSSGNFEMGWFGEAWKNGNWCGDTLVRDANPDTLILFEPDTLRNILESTPTPDTVFITKQSTFFDSLMITTTTIHKQIVLRDSANDPFVDIVNIYTAVIDSDIIAPCSNRDFITDTGGVTEGSIYFNYYYKFRNYWAQLPFVWNNWQGYDSATVSPYNSLLITYKGLLPTHQINLSFIYGTWGPWADTMATAEKRGDGVGILTASPDEWKTVVIPIPDSVQLKSITGIVLAIENAPNKGGKTSEAGNLKIHQISLISSPISVEYRNLRRKELYDRYRFTPKTNGNVIVSIYSLNGVLLNTTSFSVDPYKTYSVHKLVQKPLGKSPEGIKIITIRGAGVNINLKIN